MGGRRERLLITGGSGFLGRTIAQMIAANFQVFSADYAPKKMPNFVPLDIRERQQVVDTFRKIRPALVIHTAALVNVDYCEDHAQEAWVTNVEGTENVAIAAKEVRAKLVYISTDSVFDGQKGMYIEEDKPNPVNVYARTKLEGEKRVKQHLTDSLVVRTAFYGWNPGASSKPSLAEWVVTTLRQGETCRMFTDVFFSPIFIENFVEAVIQMSQKGLSGMYHVGGSEKYSKYAFGQRIAEVFGLNKELIVPVSIDGAGLRGPRPKDVSLNVSKASGVINTRLLDVREGITRFKETEHMVKVEAK
jgi:dTDP-4-dehydrorhamnose reductase